VPFIKSLFPIWLKPSPTRIQGGMASQAVEKLGFVSGHDFSRAVND
jgi:hypothetical protein